MMKDKCINQMGVCTPTGKMSHWKQGRTAGLTVDPAFCLVGMGLRKLKVAKLGLQNGWRTPEPTVFTLQ